MPFERTAGGGTMVYGDRAVQLAQLLATRSALSLELKGIRASRNYSAYAVIKQRFGYKGNKQSVYEQFSAHVEAEKLRYAADKAVDPSL